MNPLPLLCPDDGSVLGEDQLCPRCHRSFAPVDGVVRMLPGIDKFYEGTYRNQVHFVPRSERLLHAWPLWLIGNGYLWETRQHVDAGSVVVELGCASGVRYFAKRFRMVGCDVSLASLRQEGGHYTCRIQVDAARGIPLGTASADAIISSYYWEHMPPDVKPRILAECYRVLRPGGKLVFLYDVATENPLIRRYRARQPELYERLFKEQDGHVGYQAGDANLEAFRVAGFRIVSRRGLEKTWLQSPSVYEKLGHFAGRAARLFRLGQALGRRPWIYPYTAFVRLVDVVVCPWLPAAWARMDLVVAEKSR